MKSDLEQHLQTLVSAKVVNLEVSLGALVNAGALAGEDPWDVFCGNGWIVRRRWPGPGSRFDAAGVRTVIREELTQAGLIKG